MEEVREQFHRRTDKLRRRHTFPGTAAVSEQYGPGAEFCLSRCDVQAGARDMTFQPEARWDNLLQRTEQVLSPCHVSPLQHKLDAVEFCPFHDRLERLDGVLYLSHHAVGLGCGSCGTTSVSFLHSLGLP